EDLERSGRFRIVTAQCGAAPCSANGEPAELVTRAREAGAKLLLIAGIHKQSTLIQWAKVQAVDVDTDRLVLDKLLTFRGDTDEAWERAEAFVAREGAALVPPPLAGMLSPCAARRGPRGGRDQPAAIARGRRRRARHRPDPGLGVELLSAGDPRRSDRGWNRRAAALGVCGVLAVAADRRLRGPLGRAHHRSPRRPRRARALQSRSRR